MWKNLIKTSFRSISRNAGQSIINILGLSVGIAVTMLILLYVQHELNFDKHLPGSENIYRVTTDMRWADGQRQETAVCMAPTPWYMMNDYAEVESSVRYYHMDPTLISRLDSDADQQVQEGIYEENIIVADTGFFEVFEFPMLFGNAIEILKKPGMVIITQEIAEKYFGKEEAVGKELILGKNDHLTVGGVLQKIPTNTHIIFDFVVSGPENPAFSLDNLRDLGCYGYIRFAPGSDIEAFKSKIPDFEKQYLGAFDSNTDLRIQPMLDIHLHNDRLYDRSVVADYSNVLIIGIIGVIILLIACINFINFAIARSSYRAKEVAIRKVNGASRNQLIWQFLGEAFMIAFVSMFFGVVLMETLLPEFREITQTNLDLVYGANILNLLGLMLIVGLISGFYPALVISRFQPMTIFRGLVLGKSRGGLQKILVVFQFAITISLVISLGLILKQMHFIKNQNLGFENKNVLYVEFPTNAEPEISQVLKARLSGQAGIEWVSTSNMMPGRVPWGEHFIPEGSENSSPHRYINVDPDYIPFFGLEIVEGRNFNIDFTTDSMAVIINETSAKEFGWSVQEAIGKKLKWNFAYSRDDMITGEVIGVIKDFHVTSLHNPIESLILTMHQSNNPIVAVRLEKGYVHEHITFIEDIYSEVFPNYPFDPIFLNQEITSLYVADRQFLQLVKYFTLIAMFIASLGLLGLSFFMVGKRFKELGIRKTFGASSGEILLLLTLEFEKWIILANLIAWPLAWFFSSRWLNQFAYKTNIPWWIFLIGFIFSLILAFLTVLYQGLKAARLRPYEAIRYE